MTDSRDFDADSADDDAEDWPAGMSDTRVPDDAPEDVADDEPKDLNTQIISLLADGDVPSFSDLVDSKAWEPWRRAFATYLANCCNDHRLHRMLMYANHFVECAQDEVAADEMVDRFGSAGAYSIQSSSFVSALTDGGTYEKHKKDLINEAKDLLHPVYLNFVEAVNSLNRQTQPASSAASSNSSANLQAAPQATTVTYTRTDVDPPSDRNQKFLDDLPENGIAYVHLMKNEGPRREGRSSSNSLVIKGVKHTSGSGISFAITKKRHKSGFKYLAYKINLPEMADRKFVWETFRKFPTPQIIEFT